MPAAARTEEGDPTHRAIRIATGVSVFVIAASVALVLTFDHGRDQSIYALVAREMLDGRMPYRDAFDFKPPGIFVIYALTRMVFGASHTGIRVVEAAAMLLSVWALVRLSETLFKRRSVGIFAGALASQIHAQLDFWHTGQPETFGGTMTLWGLVLCLRGMAATTRRASAIAWAGAGVLFGCAGLMKPPLAGAGALVVLLVVGRELWEKRSLFGGGGVRTWVPLVAMFAGAVLPIALTVAWFASKGALHAMHEVLFVFTPYYTKIGWQDASVFSMTYYGFVEWLTGYSSAFLTGLICLLVFRPTKEELPGVVAVLGCIFVHIAGIVMQAKFFPYHWGATFPLTALLAALGLEKALTWSTRRGRLGTLGFVGVFSLLAATKCPVPSFGEAFGVRIKERARLVVAPPPDKELAWDGLATIADVNASQNRAVARYLKEHTAPDAPVFVWGFECAIYDWAERPLSSRYIYNVPQRAVWSAKPMQEALMVDLRAKPPAAIVVEHHDVFPMVTGSRHDSANSLLEFPELDRMIDAEYSFAERIGDFDIYMRDAP